MTMRFFVPTSRRLILELPMYNVKVLQIFTNIHTLEHANSLHVFDWDITGT